MFQKITSYPQIFTIFVVILLSIISIGVYHEYTNPQITIQWLFENEIDVLGFNLYRSISPDEDFIQVNQSLIPPADDPMVGGEHFFTDYDIEWRTTYYYQLEILDRLGKSEKIDPIPLRAQFNPLTR